MSSAASIHERLMNGSRMIPPRVGVGVGDGVVAHPCLSSYGRDTTPVDNGQLASSTSRDAWMAAPRQNGSRA